jgi:hypothetical protein
MAYSQPVNLLEGSKELRKNSSRYSRIRAEGHNRDFPN